MKHRYLCNRLLSLKYSEINTWTKKELSEVGEVSDSVFYKRRSCGVSEYSLQVAKADLNSETKIHFEYNRHHYRKYPGIW